MNSWAIRRKRIVMLIVFSALIILIGLPTYFFLYRAPTCFDNRLNGDESGVDCGGSCQLLCTAESLPLLIKGDPQVLEISDGIYEVVVLVDNTNPNAEIYSATYTFNLYSATSTIPIKVIQGSTYIPRSATIAVFEGPFNIESGARPVRASFAWEETSLAWRQNNTTSPALEVKDLNLTRASSTPRLDAKVENLSLEDVSNIDLTALLFDEGGTIFAASKTFIDILPAQGSSPAVFSWPEPFKDNIIDVEIIVRVLPDRSFIR